MLKFIYSEKATQFCEISTLLLSYVVPVKSRLEISQNCVAFSEYMNFTYKSKTSSVLTFSRFIVHTFQTRSTDHSQDDAVTDCNFIKNYDFK